MSNEILSELKKLANLSIASHSQKFFKTQKGEYGHGDIFLGIRVGSLRKLATQYKKISDEEAAALLSLEFHEARLLALFLMINLFQKNDESEKEKIFNLYLKNIQYINNWDLVDISAPKIIGAFLYNKDRSLIYKLALSDNLMIRRIAVLSTFHFIRKKDFEDTLKLCEILLPDKEDLIHKATGWMLREVAKFQLKEAQRFLKKHYKKMPRTMLRYAIEKFPEKLRKQYLYGEI